LEAEAQRRAIQVGDASTARGATTHSSCVRKSSCEYGSRSPCRRSQLPGLELVATLQSTYPAVTAMACRCMYCISMLRHQISPQCLRESQRRGAHHSRAHERGATVHHTCACTRQREACRAVCCGVLQCVAVRYSVLQCVAVRCSVLRCVVVCCRELP